MYVDHLRRRRRERQRASPHRLHLVCQGGRRSGRRVPLRRLVPDRDHVHGGGGQWRRHRVQRLHVGLARCRRQRCCVDERLLPDNGLLRGYGPVGRRVHLQRDGLDWRVSTQPAENPVIPEIWCTSSTFCAMADDAGVLTYNGTTWTPRMRTLPAPRRCGPTPSGRKPTTVMCTSPTFCVVVATGDEAVTFDGTQWSVPTRLVSGIGSPVERPA